MEIRICTECNDKPAAKDRTVCNQCKSKSFKTRAITNGKCTKCNKPHTEDGRLCKNCKIYYAQDRIKRKEAGLCIKCGMNPPNNSSRCDSCCFTSMAQGKTNKKLIEEAWVEQNGICSLSGQPIELGLNASLDHIIPKNKGGTEEKNNLRIADVYVNKAKNDLLDSVFFEMSANVTIHNASKLKISQRKELLKILLNLEDNNSDIH